MQQQASLEARFEELLGARDALKAMNNKEPTSRTRRSSERRQRTPRHHNRQQQPQENPDVSDNLAHAHTMRARLMSLVGDLINEIDAEGTWTTLDGCSRRSGREDEAREEAFAREREVTAKVKALRTQLVEEKEAHVAYTTEKARLMEGYKEELKEKKGATGLRLRFIRKDLEANSERLSREQMQELNRLQREIDETQAKIDGEGSERGDDGVPGEAKRRAPGEGGGARGETSRRRSRSRRNSARSRRRERNSWWNSRSGRRSTRPNCGSTRG